MAVVCSGCGGDPSGEDATLEVHWCVYGEAADADWCALAGIETVQMVEDDDPLEDFSWPCAEGSYVSDGPVLAAGDYFVRFEGLDETGYVVASAPDPEDSPDDHVTVEEGDDIVLDGYDLDAGQVGDLRVPVLFEAGSPDGASCRMAGVDRVGYEFSALACGDVHRRGPAVYADESGGGVSCDRASFTLDDVPFGVYDLEVTGFGVDAAWSGSCSGIVLRGDLLEAEPCVVPRTR